MTHILGGYSVAHDRTGASLAMNKTASNERRRITATALNNLSVSLIVTGVIIPVVGLAYQMTYPQTRYWAAFAVMWLAMGIGLHLIARRIVGRIEE